MVVTDVARRECFYPGVAQTAAEIMNKQWMNDTPATACAKSTNADFSIDLQRCKGLAEMFNMIEQGASWPKQLRIARAAFLAKEEDSDMGPIDYRVLLMLSSVYRLYGKIRLPQLQP